MAEILVRELDPRIVERLKARAKRGGRSLQNEAKMILENAAGLTPEEARVVTGQWRRAMAGRRFGDSAKLVREDRQR